MKSKSIKGNSSEEIKNALLESRADGFEANAGTHVSIYGGPNITRLKLPLSFILLIFLTFSLRMQAQLNRLNLSYIPETDGAEIYDVLADRMGNIWMATHSGLVRYDGYELKRYYPDPNDSTTIGDILTYRLFEDRSGKIWIGCSDYISVYNPETRSFINYRYLQQTDFPLYSQAFVLTITQDGRGRIYFGIASTLGVIAEHALVYFDEKDGQIRRFDYPDSVKITNQYGSTSDPSGNVWITGESGIFRIDTARTIFPVTISTGTTSLISGIQSDRSGKIWAGSYDANLFCYDPEKGTSRSWSMKDHFMGFNGWLSWVEMTIDPSDKLWIASNLGLIQFDMMKEIFSVFGSGPDQKVLQESVFGLDLDSFGDLWCGTSSDGLVRYSKRIIMKSFISGDKEKSSITSGWAYKINENKDGSIWIATSGESNFSGLNLLDPVNLTVTTIPYQTYSSGLEWSSITAEFKAGEFLMGSNQGNIVFSSKNKTFSKAALDPPLDSQHIFNIFRDSRDNEWYGTADGLFVKNMESNHLRHYSLDTLPGSNVTSNEVTNVFESKKHGLWLLTNYGLFLYDYNADKIKRLGYDKSQGDILVSQDINSFYEDSAGIAWVGTWQGGLSRLNLETGKIRNYTTSDGLPSICIQGILADEKNNALWLSTFAGLSRFSIDDEQFNNFSLEDGIQGLLFADGACLKTSKGLFIFGGNNGITVFNPDDIARNSPPPVVFIEEFKIGNTSRIITEGHTNDIVLSYDQNNISIEYTGIHYANPSRNKFAYKLDNYDDDWRGVGNLRTAYYYGLPPGKYTFKVKAANSNGVWNETGASIHFRITPPWWRTWWAYVLYGLLFAAGLFAIDRMQRKRILEKGRSLAREKELEQAREIEKAYNKLKTTQSQLIQSEKMASLGELTAGIAHEIQNPLNFVNNFSEVSIEMIDEMKQESAVSSQQSAIEVIDDIRKNLDKILHHGKRADAIVKGMLQHSRTSTGQKEPTDINALCDEYLRLAYHGLRAKDKSFNAAMKTDFDESIGKINIIPQDIGRVMLNLITNAFYAVNERNASHMVETQNFASLTGISTNPGIYEPTVTVTTRKSGDRVEISVKDNGNGIPDHIKDKIFQPFFTTKPSGQGTGLGLSLSYDIVKAHGGELNVNTHAGEGTEFIILIPG
jgi:signal transduction histidine kinase/ligand-binding sensor domain-containing protein